jgi:NADPH2:quinone reductase
VLSGADMIAVATGPAKLDLCRERGASTTIDLATEDVRARLREAGGADLVIDMIGGPSTELAVRSLRPGGRLVTVGYASGEIPRIPLNLVLLKGISILGLELRTFVERFPEVTAAARRELLDHLATGRIRPYIGARFPLADAAAAMRMVADRVALGKVVIDIG